MSREKVDAVGGGNKGDTAEEMPISGEVRSREEDLKRSHEERSDPSEGFVKDIEWRMRTTLQY